MAYRCKYRQDRGVICSSWTREDVDYCDRHQEMMNKIDVLEKEVNEVIRAAREK